MTVSICQVRYLNIVLTRCFYFYASLITNKYLIYAYVILGHTHREEYVEEDGGLMFRGVYNRIKPTPWNYAQYEKDILECALYLVREIGKVCRLRLIPMNE